jgi:hypothetical protein
VKVMALIYGDENRWDSLSDEERQTIYGRYRAFGEAAGSKVLDGAELAPTRTATTVRVRDGQVVVTDGPFTETKEALGGFYLLDVETLDEAAALVAQIPGAATGAIEVRAAHEEDAA